MSEGPFGGSRPGGHPRPPARRSRRRPGRASLRPCAVPSSPWSSSSRASDSRRANPTTTAATPRRRPSTSSSRCSSSTGSRSPAPCPGDAGCDDQNLAHAAVSFMARGFDQTTPTKIYLYGFRDRPTFERLLPTVDTCAKSYATDPAAFGSVQVSPYVADGPGPWGPQFTDHLRDALTKAAGGGRGRGTAAGNAGRGAGASGSLFTVATAGRGRLVRPSSPCRANARALARVAQQLRRVSGPAGPSAGHHSAGRPRLRTRAARRPASPTNRRTPAAPRPPAGRGSSGR